MAGWRSSRAAVPAWDGRARSGSAPRGARSRSARHNRPLGAGGEAVAEITAAGGEAFYLDTDVRSPADVAALVTAAEQRWGRIDVLYASAGVMPVGAAPDTSEDDYQLAVDVNLGGCFRLAKY